MLSRQFNHPSLEYNTINKKVGSSLEEPTFFA